MRKYVAMYAFIVYDINSTISIPLVCKTQFLADVFLPKFFKRTIVHTYIHSKLQY